MELKTYVVQYIHKYGNGWAIINAQNPAQAESILKNQGRFPDAQVIAIQERERFGDTMHIVYAGSVTTLGQTPYDLAKSRGFNGTLEQWLESLKGPKGEKGETGPTGPAGTTDYNNLSNKPNLAPVATSGSYNDLTDKPDIAAAQIQADWNQSDNTKADYIKNKPTIPTVTGKADKVSNATNGNFAGLDSNGNLTDSGKKASDFATAAQGALAASAYQKPSSGIPASDLASGVIPDVSGKEDTSNKTSDISTNKTSTTKYPTTKGVADYLDAELAGIEDVLDAILGADTLHEQKKMDIVSASGTTLSALVNTYYNFASEVNTLAVTLPSVTDSTHINNIVFMLTTGSTPAVTFAAPSGINVIAQDGFSIVASTTYEINAIFNGIAWVIAAMKLSTTPINS